MRDLTEVKRLQVQLAQNEKLSALGEMVSGVAHELNNPLTAVFGFAQLLLAEDLPGEQKEEVRHIYTHAERCKRIIDGLLKISRRHGADRVRTNLNEVVQSTLDLLGYQLRLANVRVERDFDATVPESMMDSFQIQQVLVNLITNAQHAVQESGRAGVVKVRTRRASATKIVVEVEDDGCGMSDAIQRRIFDPFFTTKGVGKGTGLGLSISYGIVKEHGGSLSATSRPGEGSTFRVELPVVAEAAASATAAREIAREDAERKLPRSRILVVDDEPIILELLGLFLRGDGARSRPRSQSSRRSPLRARGFDVVFAWRMPCQTATTSTPRSAPRTPPNGRFVFLTGDAIGGEVSRSRDASTRRTNRPFTRSIRRDGVGAETGRGALRADRPLAQAPSAINGARFPTRNASRK